MAAKKPAFVIRQYTKSGHLIKEYTDIESASANSGATVASIEKVISGAQKTAGNFLWEMVEPGPARKPAAAKPEPKAEKAEEKPAPKKAKAKAEEAVKEEPAKAKKAA